MTIKELTTRPHHEHNIKLHKKFLQFENLLTELESRELPDEIIIVINNHIEEINTVSNSEKELKKN